LDQLEATTTIIKLGSLRSHSHNTEIFVAVLEMVQVANLKKRLQATKKASAVAAFATRFLNFSVQQHTDRRTILYDEFANRTDEKFCQSAPVVAHQNLQQTDTSHHIT
jgi:hypothetical protein